LYSFDVVLTVHSTAARSAATWYVSVPTVSIAHFSGVADLLGVIRPVERSVRHKTASRTLHVRSTAIWSATLDANETEPSPEVELPSLRFSQGLRSERSEFKCLCSGQLSEVRLRATAVRACLSPVPSIHVLVASSFLAASFPAPSLQLALMPAVWHVGTTDGAQLPSTCVRERLLDRVWESGLVLGCGLGLGSELRLG